MFEKIGILSKSIVEEYGRKNIFEIMPTNAVILNTVVTR